ncbi:MAG: hypothetical protein HYX66_03155 [Ignavibacteria bacterium]|nr:hypothetical protein [Ignavibacteria bacterium]
MSHTKTWTLRLHIQSVSCCLLLLLAPVVCHAQWWKGKSPEQINLFSVGFAADAAVTMHTGDFTLPYAPTCCPAYTTSTTIGASLSGFIRNEFSKVLRATLRLTYAPYNANFSTDQGILVTNSTPGTVRYSLGVKMVFIGAEVLADIRIANPIRLMLGGSAGAMTQASYSQKENLIVPGVGTFENGLRVRNQTTNAEMQQLSSTVVGVVGGVGFDIPMTVNHSVMLTPEVLYTIGLTDIVEGVAWKADQLRVGVGIGFALNAPDPPLPIFQRKVEYVDSVFADVPPDGAYKRSLGIERVELDTVVANDTVMITERVYRTDTVSRPLRPTVVAKFSARALHPDGVLADVYTVNISTQFITEALPLLPVVFFESQSISISFRYHQVKSAKEFDIQAIEPRTTSVHRDVLNIIGQRMLERPASSISLIGNSDPTTEGADCSLAEKRANEVKNYLVNVWGIESSRIQLAERSGSCAPSKVTREPSEDGFSENRRVEIETADLELLAPVAQRRFNEARSVTPPSIVLDPSGTHAVSGHDAEPTQKYFTSWKVEGSSGAKILFSQTGQGAPQSITQQLTPATADLMREDVPMKIRLTVEALQGTHGSAEAELSVRKDTLKTEIERLTLTLFDVSSDEVTPVSENQIKDFIDHVPVGATVIVRGFADMLGNAEFNRKLSARRAQSVCSTIQKYLRKKVNIDCSEVATDKFPPGIDSYKTPEERFLSRTVQIEVIRSR